MSNHDQAAAVWLTVGSVVVFCVVTAIVGTRAILKDIRTTKAARDRVQEHIDAAELHLDRLRELTEDLADPYGAIAAHEARHLDVELWLETRDDAS